MRIRITTTDTAFATEVGTVVTIPDESAERLTFAGREMIRFDMALAAAGRLPRDWGNRWTMYPVARIVS